MKLIIMRYKNYLAVLTCVLNHVAKTSSYQIENQTQCFCEIRPYHTILQPTVTAVQHLFQLYLQRSPLFFFYNYD